MDVEKAEGVVIVISRGNEREDLPVLLTIAGQEGIDLKVFCKNSHVESFVVRGKTNEVDEINSPLDPITSLILEKHAQARSSREYRLAPVSDNSLPGFERRRFFDEMISGER